MSNKIEVELPIGFPEGYELAEAYISNLQYTDGLSYYGCMTVNQIEGRLHATLRKKKTYTDVVKASGWEWPAIKPEFECLAMDEDSDWVAFREAPEALTDFWTGGRKPIDPNGLVDFERPPAPEVHGFTWKETLLKRSDFITV
jgi:hypothetical protein